MACMGANISSPSQSRAIWSGTTTSLGLATKMGFCALNWRPKTPARDHSRCCMCMTMPSAPLSAKMLNGGNNSVLATILHPQVLPSKVDDNTKMLELQERTQLALRRSSSETTTTDALKLIDTLQRLGIGYHFQEDINALLLQRFSDGLNPLDDEDLFTTALCFRLLRQNGYRMSPST
ncbi:hypothetical protein RHMOL_Rhmol04G0085900 [Rhododendron molle]|uniref:Uncharacterized protein n=1 Tax=Rhododendron molle TaxID=49168 RepID=A0ACC0NZM3_RHOML|nr:hypothetical protein RHMOL_Rhmol04G0085900 [Rhododendron molle]